MRVICILILIIVTSIQPVSAMMRVGQAPVTQKVTAAGFFGGIKQRTTFVLNLSEQGGLLYFRVDPSLTVLYRGERVGIDRLPINTPIAVTTDRGLVIAVDVQKGD